MHFLPKLPKTNFNIVHIHVHIKKYVTWLRSIDKKLSKISDIATITTFSIPPFSTRNPGIIPSDDPGEALSVSSKDIHLSKHAKIPVTTVHKRHRQTDRRTLASKHKREMYILHLALRREMYRVRQ